jgi:hypothetical protein
VATHAAITRSGDGLQLFDCGEAILLDRHDDRLFGHLQAAANDPIRATANCRTGIARANTIFGCAGDDLSDGDHMASLDEIESQSTLLIKIDSVNHFGVPKFSRNCRGRFS